MVSKILCATDGTEHSNRAVAFAADLAKRTGAPLTVAAVNVASGGPRGPVLYHWEEAEARKLVDDAAKSARAAGAKIEGEFVLQAREASSAIVHFAEEKHYDVIVTGTGDKRGVSRLMLGSVAADISARAHCTVIVAR